ncbi:hypothetical protein MXB_3578 [Myxobolus squamalis]|nr:hypothetical protein MXB_3578 [Myxobolus squamalis]
MAIFDSPMQLDDNLNSNNSYPQASEIYQSPFQAQNIIETIKNENSNCWNTIGTQQNYNRISNDNQMNNNIISWTPLLQSQAFIQQSNSVGDDNYKNIVLVGSTISNNNFSNYAMIQPSFQNGRNYWSSPDNFEYLVAKDKESTYNQQPLYSDVKICSQRTNNDIITQNGTKYISSLPQNQCVIISDSCIRNMDVHQFPKQWLTENFQRVDEECTIARSLMYGYYVHACFLRCDTPMNSAGLGKIIRNVFGNIKNRRLGARGDSRYHYLGIKIIETSYILNIPSKIVNDIVLNKIKCGKNTCKLSQKNIDCKNNESSNETNDIMNKLFHYAMRPNESRNNYQDNYIEKCILNYSKKLFFSIIEKYLGNIKDNLSVEYLDKIVTLCNVMKKSIECSLINYSKYFITGMINILKKVIEIAEEYKSMHVARINLLNIIINNNDQVIKMYNVCHEISFDQIIEDFHYKNLHFFQQFPINIKEFKDFFIQLVIAPLHNNSQEWLYIIEEKILQIHNSIILHDKQNNQQLPYNRLIFDWCTYQFLINQYLFDHKTEITNELVLYKLSLKMMAFHEKYLNIKNQNYQADDHI